MRSNPISAINFRSDKKYHGVIPSNIMVAVNIIAFPVVVKAASIAFVKS